MNLRPDDRQEDYKEDLVNRVLQRVGIPDLPAGLERRILAAVEQRAAVRSSARRGWLRWPMVSNPLAYAGTFASVIAILFAVTATHRSKPASAPLRNAAAKHPQNTTPQVASIATPSPTASTTKLSRTASRRDLPTQKAAPVSQAGASKVSQILAASYPAPPMPLTEQERLLLRVVRRGDPQELAMLRPEVRTQREASSAVEFQTFFEPLPSKEQRP